MMTRRELFDVVELLVEDHFGDLEDIVNARADVAKGTDELSSFEALVEYENLVDELAGKAHTALVTKASA